MSTCIIYAIAGPSGSGKTTLAHALQRHLGKQDPDLDVSIISEDAYFRDQAHIELAAREDVNYDHPDALEHELLDRHLQELRAGKTITVPQYDYHRHTRRREVRHLAPPDLLIVEGILLLSNPGLRAHFDFSVFIDASLSRCLQRRIVRDCSERGRSPDFVGRQFETTVRPMYHRFVLPSRGHADWLLAEDFEAEPVLDTLFDRVREQQAPNQGRSRRGQRKL